MNALILVMSGGAIGAAGRYLVGNAARALWGGGWPWGTLTVNIVGGFVMGLVAALFAARVINEPTRLLLATGVLGGFTTFSAFSLEVVTMIEAGRSMGALGYALASVAGSVLALWCGMMVARGIA
jgi:CrcB protein